MKKIVQTLVAAAAIVFSSGAMAQYITAAGGMSAYNIDCAGVTDCDETDAAWKVVLGWRIGQSGFAAELGYIDWGSASWRQFGLPGEVSLKSTTLGAAYRLPFGTNWEAYFRLGAAKNESKGRKVGINYSEDQIDFYSGAGMRYAVTKHIKLDVSADLSRVELDTETGGVVAVMLGLTIDF